MYQSITGTKTDFQTDTLNLLSDWLELLDSTVDRLGTPSGQYHFENPHKGVEIKQVYVIELKIVLTV